MTRQGRIVLVAALAAFVTAGCSLDVAKQLTSNEQVRTQVLDAIAANKDLTGQLLAKLTATDSTRVGFVDAMLQNEEVAKQVIVRVGTNPAAIDMVLGVAARDSVTREHVLTLVKGIALASQQAAAKK